MFAEFLRRLTTPSPAPLADDDARLALAALLVRLARSDGDYAEIEIRQIDTILSDRFGLSPFEVADLRAKAETLESEAPDTVRFTRAIKDAVPHEERVGVLQSMWAVVLADGTRDDHEDSSMRVIANLLGINDRESARARHAAEGRSA
ncbi:TerB family tellurite resistance protein [Alisedimentitalea sp. MJ-SS2]|uniref:tellurite resistance TerB family protein n=1 Tax=Aliisedimentitalea sp. MJ-SS2 TaxID=3049795 RepID=UPI00290D2610|nr:TerB family tellurite resistance protein [Alisedimentitalea sp. MJ-SS2]MDU8926422.1 TerB family tellurite resistance protein [Alisedimentitalea sp. MJ-SS2]